MMSSVAVSFHGISLRKAVSRCPTMSMAGAASPPRTALPARSRSLYEVLRVSSTATAGEIKAAYRSLAKRLHPDVAPAGASANEFMEIQMAYGTLSDPALRSQYDLSLGRLRRPHQNGGKGAVRFGRWETDQCW